MADEITNVEGSKDISTVNTGDNTSTKTYTESEVQALLQQETDRRVSSALKKQQKAFETKMAEADKLRSMDKTQREEYEYNQRVLALEQKEREFAIAQNKLEATKVLSNRGLPIAFVDYIVADDAETMLENINTFEKAFKAAVQDEVAKKISTPTPKNNSMKQTGMTRDEFKKLNVAQQAEMYSTNPTLYKRMTGN